MWKLVLVRLEIVLISTHDRCTVCAERTMLVKWKLLLVHLEIVLITTQDRCTVCVERTIGMEIISGTPDGSPW